MTVDLNSIKSPSAGDGFQCYCIVAHMLIACDGGKSNSESHMLLYHALRYFDAKGAELQNRMQQAQASSIAAINMGRDDLLPIVLTELKENTSALQRESLYKMFEELAWCDGLAHNEEKILTTIREVWEISDAQIGVGSDALGNAEELYAGLAKSKSGCLIWLFPLVLWPAL